MVTSGIDCPGNAAEKRSIVPRNRRARAARHGVAPDGRDDRTGGERRLGVPQNLPATVRVHSFPWLETARPWWPAPRSAVGQPLLCALAGEEAMSRKGGGVCRPGARDGKAEPTPPARSATAGMPRRRGLPSAGFGRRTQVVQQTRLGGQHLGQDPARRHRVVPRARLRLERRRHRAPRARRQADRLPPLPEQGRAVQGGGRRPGEADPDRARGRQ